MKKYFFMLFTFIFCTSLCHANSISTNTNINIIINSKKQDFNNPVLIYNGYTLVPFREICNILNISNEDIHFDNNYIYVKNGESKLVLKINSKTIYINSLESSLPISPILYKNTTYVPLRIISEFNDCVVLWDDISRTIFIKNNTEYEQVKKFFSRVEEKVSSLKTLQMDIINEVKENNSSYSFGNSIFIDRNSNKIFYKNILSDSWIYETTTFNSTSKIVSSSFNDILYAGLSFDKYLSDENFMIFSGFYPLSDGTLCNASIYINTTTLMIDKVISKFYSNNSLVSQQVLYTSEF